MSNEEEWLDMLVKDPRVGRIIESVASLVEDNDYLRQKNSDMAASVIIGLNRIIEFSTEVVNDLNPEEFGQYRTALICLKSVRDQLVVLRNKFTKGDIHPDD